LDKDTPTVCGSGLTICVWSTVSLEYMRGTNTWENHMNPMECKHTCSGIIGASVPQIYYLCKVDSGTCWMVWQLYSFSVLSQHELDGRLWPKKKQLTLQ